MITQFMTDEPRLKALTYPGMDDAIVRDVLDDCRMRAGFDFLALAKQDGAISVLSRSSAAERLTLPPSYRQPAKAPATPAIQFLLQGGQLYLTAVAIVRSGPDNPSLMLVSGMQFTSEVAQGLRRVLDVEVVLLIDKRITAGALAEHLDGHREELATGLAQLPKEPSTQGGAMNFASRKYLVRKVPVDAFSVDAGTRSSAQAFFALLSALENGDGD